MQFVLVLHRPEPGHMTQQTETASVFLILPNTVTSDLWLSRHQTGYSWLLYLVQHYNTNNQQLQLQLSDQLSVSGLFLLISEETGSFWILKIIWTERDLLCWMLQTESCCVSLSPSQLSASVGRPLMVRCFIEVSAEDQSQNSVEFTSEVTESLSGNSQWKCVCLCSCVCVCPCACVCVGGVWVCVCGGVWVSSCSMNSSCSVCR